MQHITIYGIKNCDTMQKAFHWLNAKGVGYTFHDYKKSGVSEELLLDWFKHLAIGDLINKRGTTWKKCTEEEQMSISDPKKAIELIIQNPSILKRPLIHSGKTYLLGFDEAEWSELF